MGACFDENNKKVLQEIKVNGLHVRRTQKLASGAFGRIWECKDVSSGQTYALKETYMGTKTSLDSYNRQVYLLNKMKTLKIQKAINHKASEIQHRGKKPKVGRIILELGTTTLFDQINTHTFSDIQILKILRDLCHALSEIHKYGIYHLDIKPENILVVNGAYKLCDFGSMLTKKIIEDELDQKQKQKLKDYIMKNSTFMYRSPQMINPDGKVIDSAADMWMLGCIAYILVFGKYPFQGKSAKQIMKADVKYTKEGYMTNLVRQLLSVDPQKRPTASELLDRLQVQIASGTE